MNTEINNLLLKWSTKISESGKGHYKSATSCRVFNYAIGIPLVLITTFIATQFFVKLETFANTPEPRTIQDMWSTLYIIVAFFTIVAPILAALQSFLRFPERANQHRQAAIGFGKLKKEIEKNMVFPPPDEKMKEEVDKIQMTEASILGEAPSIGTLSLRRCRKEFLKKMQKGT